MKVEKMLLRFIFVLLTIAVLAPIILLLSVKDKTIAGQIGDALGGTSAPLVNISAILAVIATYIYQRRNDQKNARRGQISEYFSSLKEELNNIDHIVTVTNKGQAEIKHHVGKAAIKYIIRALNNNEYENFDVRELVTYQPIINVYKYFHLLIQEVKTDSILPQNDQELFLTQFSLFYHNNLFINKEQRGDEICKHHKVKHEIPQELYQLLLNIENTLT